MFETEEILGKTDGAKWSHKTNKYPKTLPDDVPLAVITVVVDPEKKEKSLMDIRNR